VIYLFAVPTGLLVEHSFAPATFNERMLVSAIHRKTVLPVFPIPQLRNGTMHLARTFAIAGGAVRFDLGHTQC
jgi:hypothetical protein